MERRESDLSVPKVPSAAQKKHFVIFAASIAPPDADARHRINVTLIEIVMQPTIFAEAPKEPAVFLRNTLAIVNTNNFLADMKAHEQPPWNGST